MTGDRTISYDSTKPTAGQLVPQVYMKVTALDGQGLLRTLVDLHHQRLEVLQKRLSETWRRPLIFVPYYIIFVHILCENRRW